MQSNETQPLDLGDCERIDRFAEESNVTRELVVIVIGMVGCMPRAIRFYLDSKSRPLKTAPDTDQAEHELRDGRKAQRGPALSGDGS